MLSVNEVVIIHKIKNALPYMSEFDKGYFLGKVEALSDKRTDNNSSEEHIRKKNIV